MAFSLRLTHKINSIGVLGIAGLLMLGALYWVGNASQDVFRKQDDSARSLGDLQNRALVAMLQMRRAEKDFLLRKDEKYVADHRRAERADDRRSRRDEPARGGLGPDRTAPEDRNDPGRQRRLQRPFRRAGGRADQAWPQRECRAGRRPAQIRARDRKRLEGVRPAVAGGDDADDAPAREGFHAARRGEVGRRHEGPREPNSAPSLPPRISRQRLRPNSRPSSMPISANSSSGWTPPW